jgi:hypothetical protein
LNTGDEGREALPTLKIATDLARSTDDALHTGDWEAYQ